MQVEKKGRKVAQHTKQQIAKNQDIFREEVNQCIRFAS